MAEGWVVVDVQVGVSIEGDVARDIFPVFQMMYVEWFMECYSEMQLFRGVNELMRT